MSEANATSIHDLAAEFGISLHDDPGLAEALARLDLGDEIPREIYGVVAEVLAYLQSADAGGV